MNGFLKVALAAALSLVSLAPAQAADNLIGKMNDTTGTPFANRAYDVGADSAGRRIYVLVHALADATGAPVLTSGNPGYFALSGPLPLPTGAATAAAQATLNTSAASIDGKLTGVATAAAQATLNTSAASIDSKLTGVATATAQSTSNTWLSNINNANGSGSDVAWDGSAASATHTSILKALWSRVAGLLTVDTVVRSTSTDRGGVLTTASTAVTLVPLNATRRGLAVQNRNAPGASYSAATSVFMNCQTTATADFHSIEVPAGALYETPTHHSGTGACSFISATANTPVYVREF